MKFGIGILMWVVGCASAPGGPGEGPQIRGRVVGPDGVGLHEVRIGTEPATESVLSFDGRWAIKQKLGPKGALPIPEGLYEVVPFKLGWWRGRDAAPLKIEYEGGVLDVPDIVLVPIDTPELDPTAPRPSEPGESRDGASIIRGG